MKVPSLHLNSQCIRDAIMNPTGGIVGVVGDVLKLCRERGLQLDWRTNRCSVRSVDSDEVELVELTLRTSVFRAILARVATLCSEKTPDSFSPYGGTGELSIGDPPAVFSVIWVNTAAEQKLDLTLITRPSNPSSEMRPNSCHETGPRVSGVA